MDISVLISWKTTYKQVGWSLGRCPHCQGLEAVRIENVIRTVAIWFIPVNREIRGKVGRCDLCGRPMRQVISAQPVPLDQWSPSRGLPTLVDKLSPSGELQLAEGRTDCRIRSLLSAAREASSLNNVDITLGLTTGVIVGVIVGIALGTYLLEQKLVPPQPDKTRFIVLCTLPCLVGGGVVGAAIHAFFKRGKVAYQRIKQACINYQLNANRLEQLSGEYGRLVSRAVRSVRDSELLPSETAS